MSENEIIDVVDGDGKIIKTITRAEAERDNHTTQNVLVFVFTPRDSVWIQKRPMHKKHFPGLWDVSACGNLLSGETPQQGAEREQLEEMGFLSQLHFAESFFNEFTGEDGSLRKRLSHIFYGLSNETPKINEEVDEFVEIPADRLIIHIKKNPEQYIPSFITEFQRALTAYRQHTWR